MDTQLSGTNKSAGSFKLSGTGLMITLTAVVMAIATIADWRLGHSLSIQGTITLPILLCFSLTALLGRWAVPLLQALKTGQIIRQEGPESHLAKAGTPTMGGLFFIPVAVIVALISTGAAPSAVAAAALTLLYGGVGFLDDWQVIRQKSNKGISPKAKLILQAVGSVLFCLWLAQAAGPEITSITFPLGLVLPLGVLFWFLAGFVPVAQSNATNLTDGLDGLAGGTAALTFLGLAILVAPSHGDLMVLSACLSGSCLGFLVHNRNPARVFMGDTGSLAIGGAMAAIALISGQLFGLLILSGIFFAESLSVMAQVGYYKATKDDQGQGKRLFKMAPLHHHFELSGWPELKVVGVFYGVTTLLLCLTVGLVAVLP